MSDMNRVPYFDFIEREHGVNAEATKEQGYEVPALVTFIRVTPHGHRGDPMEFIADEFIERKGREAKAGTYGPHGHEWVSAFKAGLEAFREGRELPREGTPILLWERILKTRREQLAHQFPTVEDLAATPDSSLGDIGLDGRVLRDMARGDIKAKTDLSPVVKELAIANETIRRQHEQIEKLAKRLDAIELLGDGQGKREKVKA